MGETGHAIEIRGLTKTFGSKVAVDSLDLTVERGSLIGLIGPNGAGKTTTIRIVMSIIFADRGELSVLGRRSAVESKDRIGYLPEERGLYRKMRVGPFLEYVARLKGVPKREAARRVREWLDKVGLADCLKKRCEELSKGMQQKVQFVASVLHEPELIILDEPFSGLDPVNSRLLRQLIDEQHKAGRTIIFSTHQMGQAEALCDRVVMIHQGKKVLDHTIPEIRSRFDPRAVLIEPVDPSRVDGVLGGIAGVSGVEASGRSVVVHVAPGTGATELIPRLAAAIPAQRIEVLRPSLEDVFIEIVAGKGTSQDERQRLLAAMRAGDSSGD